MLVPPTAEGAREYLRRRYEFSSAVGRTLVEGLTPASDGYIVYGVWLRGHSDPIYIGQSVKARRRLWDLPIGESHHLANSFPPETWGRVVVVRWHDLIERGISNLHPRLFSLIDRIRKEKRIPRQKVDAWLAVGLAFEYLLQMKYAPVFNEAKKSRDGTWRMVRFERSRSVGAVIAAGVRDLFEEVRAEWEAAAIVESGGQALMPVGEYSFAVFPGLLPESPSKPTSNESLQLTNARRAPQHP